MAESDKPLLVVDDEAYNRDMLGRRLQRAGYEVRYAEDAFQALAVLDSCPVDLVLLDAMMPGMSGTDLLGRLRQQYSPAELPVIMVTAVTESERVVEALRLGANDYVTKPLDFPVALARIQSQLARKRAEEALRISEQRYALAARGSNDGLWDWNLKGGSVYYSRRWKEMIGLEDGQSCPTLEDWLSRVHREDRERVRGELQAAIANSTCEEITTEYRILHQDGGYRWMLTRAVILRDEEGQAIRAAGSQTDVTHSKAFDPLTGLPGRPWFMERLARSLERAQQESGYHFAVLFLDLDRFKLVNDSYGHAAGDKLLVQASRRFSRAIRRKGCDEENADVVARLGGDEFAILLEAIDGEADARAIAARIDHEMRTPFLVEGRELFSSASMGIALSHAGYQEPAELLRDADTAMYRAKALGRGRFEVFNAELRADLLARLELENDLQRAIQNNELSIYYQPKLELHNRRLVGFEALLRWQHPRLGQISPATFIPIAEETGLILPIGSWVLREACRQTKEWNEAFPEYPPLEISVNLSLKQFRDPHLVRLVAGTIQETGIHPSCLQLEITESTVVEDLPHTLAVFAQLHALGVGMKIDDFGTGYSSLNQLRELPFDSLKIDGSFVSRLCEDLQTREIVRTIMKLAQSLGMDVTAEGIETTGQLEHLLQFGCPHGQGYLFAKPLPVPSARDYIRQKRPGSQPAPGEAA